MKTINDDENEFKIYGAEDNLTPEEIKKNEKKSKLIGTLFLTWFIASFIILLSCGSWKNGPSIMLVTFGQYFLVFGILIVSQNRKNKMLPLLFTFPIVGITVASCGLYLWFGGPDAPELLSSIAPIFILVVFLYFGIAMIISANNKQKELQEKCIVLAGATVTDILESTTHTNKGRSVKVYSPVYTITNPKNPAEKIEITNKIYSNNLDLEIGDYEELLVNPDNPNEFIDKHSKKTYNLMRILGAIFIPISLIALYIVLDNMGLLELIKPFIPMNLTH